MKSRDKKKYEECLECVTKVKNEERIKRKKKDQSSVITVAKIPSVSEYRKIIANQNERLLPLNKKKSSLDEIKKDLKQENENLKKMVTKELEDNRSGLQPLIDLSNSALEEERKRKLANYQIDSDDDLPNDANSDSDSDNDDYLPKDANSDSDNDDELENEPKDEPEEKNLQDDILDKHTGMKGLVEMSDEQVRKVFMQEDKNFRDKVNVLNDLKNNNYFYLYQMDKIQDDISNTDNQQTRDDLNIKLKHFQDLIDDNNESIEHQENVISKYENDLKNSLNEDEYFELQKRAEQDYYYTPDGNENIILGNDAAIELGEEQIDNQQSQSAEMDARDEMNERQQNEEYEKTFIENKRNEMIERHLSEENQDTISPDQNLYYQHLGNVFNENHRNNNEGSDKNVEHLIEELTNYPTEIEYNPESFSENEIKNMLDQHYFSGINREELDIPKVSSIKKIKRMNEELVFPMVNPNGMTTDDENFKYLIHDKDTDASFRNLLNSDLDKYLDKPRVNYYDQQILSKYIFGEKSAGRPPGKNKINDRLYSDILLQAAIIARNRYRNYDDIYDHLRTTGSKNTKAKYDIQANRKKYNKFKGALKTYNSSALNEARQLLLNENIINETDSVLVTLKKLGNLRELRLNKK